MTQASLPGDRDAARRAAAIEGLAAFAAFLAARPDLPLGAADPFMCSVKGGSDAQNRAEVDRIAAILGVTAGDAPVGTHYGAARDFGGGVTYSAWTFTARRRPSPLCPCPDEDVTEGMTVMSRTVAERVPAVAA